MYSIKIKAESGADLRKQLLALLGGTMQYTLPAVLESTSPQELTVQKTASEALDVLEQNRQTAAEALERQPYESTGKHKERLEGLAEKEPTKRTRRTKEQIAADQALEKEEVKETAQNLEHSESPNLEVKEDKIEQKPLKSVDFSLSQQDLVNKAIQLGPGRKEEIRAILKDYGVEKIPSLEQKDYAGFMGKLEELENLVEA